MLREKPYASPIYYKRFYRRIEQEKRLTKNKTLDSNKMAANNEDVQHISSACGIAKQVLEAIENLHNNDIRNVAALTATNRASTSSVHH